LNLRPSGYEPDELPDCSTPHRKSPPLYRAIRLMQVIRDSISAERHPTLQQRPLTQL
jgi:hypothetical protein